MKTVVTLGECLIDFVATATGTLASAPAFTKAAGGAPANVAACVAKLGGRAVFIGKRGEDPFGEFLESVLRECGVDTRYFTTTAHARTGLAFVALDERGDRSFVFYRDPAADMLLTPEDVPDAVWADAGILHVGSVSLATEPARSATLHAVQTAKQHGVLVSYDPNWRPALWARPEEGLQWIEAVYPYCDVIKVNREELLLTTGQSDPAAGAAALHDRGMELVLVTLDADGAFYSCRPRATAGNGGTEHTGFSGYVQAPRVPVVDTTGAGDAFIGAFLAQLVEHPDGRLEEAALRRWVHFAVQVASRVTTRPGAIPALPTRAELIEALGPPDSSR